MDAQFMLPALAALLVTLCVGGVAAALFYPTITRGSPLENRTRAIAAAPSQRVISSASGKGSTRKRSVEDTLREALEKQTAEEKSAKAKPTLRDRIKQAGLVWTNRQYYLICIGVGGFATLFTLLTGVGGALAAVGFGISAGLLMPHLYVSFRRKRRFAAFTKEFPTAIDLIVRGIKSGLPLVDGLKIAAAETQEPVRSEFRAVVEDQTLGLPLDEAVQRMPERIPTTSARFFAIVIAIQSRTGGNLSEALGNLSKVLRERKKMEDKIKSVSSEAKASAAIIGSLPLVFCGIMYIMNPDYLGILFTNATGNLVVAGSLIWMSIGIFIMRKMINFDF